METTLLIAIGGAIGAVLRYTTGIAALHLFGKDNVITGTLIANITGCLLAGILLAVFTSNEPANIEWQLFLGAGILGSYTTFSTFSLEAWRMFEEHYRKLALYMFFQIVVALGSTGFAFQITSYLLEF